MPNPRRGANWTNETVLSESAFVRIADVVERRLLKHLQPATASGLPEEPPRHIDQDDLMTPQQAAHLIGKSDQTIYRWIAQFGIGIRIAGTTFVSRRKLEAHFARRGTHGSS
jgi:hypothetical protein